MNAARKRQRGATIIEFSLVLLLFLTFTMGIVDFSRMLYMWNAATEAARAGARYAVVCDDTGNLEAVRNRMRAMVPQVDTIALDWVPNGCNSETCEGVTLTITGMQYQWISPIAGAAKLPPMAMPPFTTFLTREVMRKDNHSAEFCSL